MLKIEDSSSEISDVFIPREYWVSDEEAMCCYTCKSPFELLNRRHHCRMCGNVFDTKCANHFLTPPTFVFENEKKIRVCDSCHHKTVLYLNKNINSIKKGLSMVVKQSSTRLLEVESVTSECLTDKVYKLSEDVLAYFLKDHHCYDKWFVILKDIIKECMETVLPTTFRCDHVDIKKFVKIKKVPYKDMSLTRLVQGLVLRKNLVNKKMGTKFENPTILMIKSNLEQTWANETCVLDANSIKRENAYLEEAVSKIVKINPSIVFVEGTVARKVQDKLTQLNKTLLVRFRKSQFNKIASCTGAQPIEDVHSFEALNPNILGTCERFEVINFKNKEFYNEVKNFRPDEFSEQSDYSMLFIEGSSGQKKATILISGPDYQELIKVKTLLQSTLQILKSLFLERTVISQEVLLLQTKERLWKLLAEQENFERMGTDDGRDIRDYMKVEIYQKQKVNEVLPITCLLNQITVGSAGYIQDFITERTPIEDLSHKSSFVFTKLLLVPNLNVGLTDLSIRASDFKAITDNSLKRAKVWYNKDLCILHRKPRVFKVYYSSKDDMTLWTFLGGFSERAFEKCAKCNRKYLHHITFYFIKKFYVQISVDLKAGTRAKKKRHTYGGKDPSKSEIGPRIEAHPGSFFNLLTTPTFDPTTPKKSALQGAKGEAEDPNKIVDIFMYIECSECKTRLSDVIKVRKAYLNNSFVRFLESLTISAGHYLDFLINQDFNPRSMGEDYPSEFLDSLKNLQVRSGLKSCCVFTPRNRVFVVDNLLVRFQVGLTKPYSVEWNSLMHQETAGKGMGDTDLIKVKKAEFLELSRNYLYLITANMNQVLLLLIQKAGLDLTLETISSGELKLDEDNPLAKEPSNAFLLQLVILYREIMGIGGQIDADLSKEIHSHLDIDAMKKSFCDQVRSIYDRMEEAKNKYFDSISTSHASLRRSTIIHEMNDEHNAEQSHFELIDLDSPSKRASHAKEEEFPSNRKSTVIKVEVEAFIVNGEYEIEKEVPYAQQITAGSCFYIEDLDYEQHIKYKFIPMFEDKPLSILAYCLNSPKYMKEVYMAEEFHNFERYINGTQQVQTVAEYKKFISSKLLCENPETLKQFNVRSPSIEIQLKFFNNLCASISGRRPKFVAPATKPNKIFDVEIIEDFVGCLQMGKVPKKEASSEKYVTPKFNIIAYYPVQFEALRNCNDINLGNFLSSISCSKDWNENSGGRTGASFIKTHDQKFVFKRLEKKEFMMLLGFAEEYFKYMWKVCGEGKPSLIAKIYGVFEIQDEKFMNYYYIAMENILYNMPGKVKIYDLKGSELNRYVDNNGQGGKTLLDTNYILDRNSQPLPIKTKYYDIVDQAIQNDCDFLCELKVVDYSLMLVQDEKNGIIKMGIIDYLRLYDLEKQLEHMGKKIIKGTNPTIIRPEEYGKRFKKAMKRFFMSISCD